MRKRKWKSWTFEHHVRQTSLYLLHISFEVLNFNLPIYWAPASASTLAFLGQPGPTNFFLLQLERPCIAKISLGGRKFLPSLVVFNHHETGGRLKKENEYRLRRERNDLFSFPRVHFAQQPIHIGEVSLGSN